MAINKKLIHFKLKSSFETELANNNILDTSIVFIQETKEIWTHGQLYKCSDPDLSNYVKESELQELLSPIQSSLANKLEVSDLAGYAKTSDIPAVVTDSTVSNWGFIKTSDANETYAPKSLVETVSNQSTTISTLATKNELSTGLAGKLDNSAASSFVPTTRTINGTALTDNIWITATDPNAATKEELNGLATTVANKAEVSALANFATTDALSSGLSGKQETLVSGTNIKTIEGKSILGSGDIQITAAEVGAYTTGEIDAKVTALNNAISGKVDPSTVTAVSDRVSTLEGYFSTAEDSDATINKWGEIVNFLDGVAEGSNVEQLLAAKANQSALNDLSTTVSNVDAKFANYLPTSGGILSDSWSGGTEIRRKDSNNGYASLIFSQEDGTILGRLGFGGVDNPLFITQAGDYNTLLHSGNYSDYALPKSGGTIEGTGAQPLIIKSGDSEYSTVKLVSSDGNFITLGYKKGKGIFATNENRWSAENFFIHSGNIGDYKAGDSAMLGGYAASVYPTFENAATCIGFNLRTDYQALGQGDGHIEFYDGGWYNSMWGKVTAVNGFVGTLTGNASSATKLATPRTIWGQSFDGTGNVSGRLLDINNQEFIYSSGTWTRVGNGTAKAGLPTYIDGNDISLRYGKSPTIGLILNSSGNVTIGDSDYAGASRRLYVDGYVKIAINKTYDILLEKAFGDVEGAGIGFWNNGWQNATISASTLYLNAGSSMGNVLIGTTTDNGAKLQVKGSVTLVQDSKIAFVSDKGTLYGVLEQGSSGNVLIGQGSAKLGCDSYVYGKNLYLGYGTTPAIGMILNSSGKVTIGDSDLAGTNYKLYVKGSFNATSGYINGNEIITSANIGSQSVSHAATAGSAPASDVYAWAKASSKPTYTKSEVGLGNVDNTADSAKSVKSAAQLTTSRTIWGQSFNGTGNVSGSMTGVSDITMSGNIKMGDATISYDSTQKCIKFSF